jgi:hypothetical protein
MRVAVVYESLMNITRGIAEAVTADTPRDPSSG